MTHIIRYMSHQSLHSRYPMPHTCQSANNIWFTNSCWIPSNHKKRCDWMLFILPAIFFLWCQPSSIHGAMVAASPCQFLYVLCKWCYNFWQGCLVVSNVGNHWSCQLWFQTNPKPARTGNMASLLSLPFQMMYMLLNGLMNFLIEQGGLIQCHICHDYGCPMCRIELVEGYLFHRNEDMPMPLQ